MAPASRRQAVQTVVDYLKQKLPAPVLLAPVGVQGIIHKDAEVATGKAAAALGVPFTISTVSSRSLEEVAKAMGDAPRWFQLYWARHPEITASLLARAEKAGYGAIVVTLDTTILAWRPRDLDHAYLPFLYADGLANYYADPAFCAELKCKPEENRTAAVTLWRAAALALLAAAGLIALTLWLLFTASWL